MRNVLNGNEAYAHTAGNATPVHYKRLYEGMWHVACCWCNKQKIMLIVSN